MQIKKCSITFALGAVVLFASNVAAHGRFLSPPTRIAEGDENQGFTKTRGPTTEEPCAGVPFQGVKSNFSPGQTIPISWEIGAAHKGACFLQLSNDNAATFKTIKEFPNCADSNGIFNDEATLPSDVTCDDCVLRWRWEALLTKELYLNCADISIGGSGGGGGGSGSGEQPPVGEQPPPSGEPQPEPQDPSTEPQPEGQPPTGGQPQPGDQSPTGEPQPGDQPPTIENPQPGDQPPTGEPQPGDQPPTGEQPGDQSPTGEQPAPTTGEPCPPGQQPPTTGTGEPSTGGETGGNTETNGSADGQVHRRSAPRGRPRRLRRSDW